MDFEYNDKTQLALSKLNEFMDKYIYPNESAYHEAHEALENRWETPALMDDLKEKARKAGLWNLFLPRSDRGPGFTNLEYAPLCEVMGRVGLLPRSSIARPRTREIWRPSSAMGTRNRS